MKNRLGIFVGAARLVIIALVFASAVIFPGCGRGNDSNSALSTQAEAQKVARAAQEEEWRGLVSERAERIMLVHTRPASVQDYKDWLRGYLEQGNVPNDVYDYPMASMIDSFFVATSDFEVVPLYGGVRIQIIIPEGINILGGSLGHNTLYFMKDYSVNGFWVPIFSDIHF